MLDDEAINNEYIHMMKPHNGEFVADTVIGSCFLILQLFLNFPLIQLVIYILKYYIMDARANTMTYKLVSQYMEV